MMRKLFFALILVASVRTWALSKPLQILPSLPVLGGTSLKLDPKTKGLVVVFMSAKCPCSDSHVPELKELSQKFKDFQFIAVHSNMDESKEKTEAYFQKAELPFPLVLDSEAVMANELKAYKTPHVFVLSPEGEILYQGGVTNSAMAPKATEHFLQAALEDLSQGRKVKVPTGRTLGCVIAREKGSYVW